MVTHHFPNVFSFCGHNSTYSENLSSPLSSHMNTHTSVCRDSKTYQSYNIGYKYPSKKPQSSTLVVWFISHSHENPTEHRAAHALLFQHSCRVFFSNFVIKESLSQNRWELFQCHCSWQLKRIRTASLGTRALHSEANTQHLQAQQGQLGERSHGGRGFWPVAAPKHHLIYSYGNCKPSCLRSTGWKRSPALSNPAKEAMSA